MKKNYCIKWNKYKKFKKSKKSYIFDKTLFLSIIFDPLCSDDEKTI